MSLVQVASVSLSTAQLKALHSQPVTVVRAPGAGRAVIVLSSLYQNFSGSDVLTSSDDGPGLYYGTNRDFGQADLSNQPFLAEDCIYLAPMLMTSLSPRIGGQGITSFMDNAPIVLANPSSNMTGGAGVRARITVLYAVVPVLFG